MSELHEHLSDDSRFDFSHEELKRLELRWRSDVDLKLDKLDRRTLLIEKLIYISSGSVIILAALAGLATTLAFRQTDRVDALIERQATDSATNSAKIKSLETEVQRLRDGRK